MKNSQRPTLGVIMIVKDEEERLASILSDIEGIVDEIVVVDTGSHDKTVNIARSYGAKLGFFVWCNDFSAARNKSIELAESDYLFWLDADDRVNKENQRKILELKKNLRPEKDRGYLFRVINRVGEASNVIALQPRIFPNRKNIMFEGRIHEQILPCMKRCGIKIENREITIDHAGYHDKKTIENKARRNLEILLDELHQGRLDANHLFHISMSYYSLCEYEKCLEYMKRARQGHGNENWYKYSFIVIAECNARLNMTDNALQELRQAAQVFPESGILFYFLGTLCLQTGRIEEAISVLEKAGSLGVMIDTFPLPSDIQEKIPFYYGIAMEKAGNIGDAIKAYRASLQVNAHFIPAQKALGMALLQTGEVADAISSLEKVIEYSDKYDRSLWLCLARSYFFVGRFEDAHDLYLRSIQESPEDKDILSGLIQTCIEMNDIESLQSSLESFMIKLGIDHDSEINTAHDLAEVCIGIADRLLDQKDYVLAKRLVDSALRIDQTSTRAYLTLADISIESGNRTEGLAYLEEALSMGAPPELIVERMDKIGKK
jgi:tetratricopeptide (TPR) repeat protein